MIFKVREDGIEWDAGPDPFLKLEDVDVVNEMLGDRWEGREK